MIIPNYTTFRAAFALGGASIDPDGLEEWPVAKVRSGGFTGGISGIAKPITAFPITLSVNAQANDAVAGVHEYDWYVSQRTDDPDRQFFTVTNADVAPNTKSGTIVLSLTGTAADTIGIITPGFDVTDNVNEEHLIILCKYVTIYVQRRSDDAIQLVNLLQATLSSI